MPVTRRVAIALPALALTWSAETARAETARAETPNVITFILVNDIYLMADQAMPDGQRRGGFARLAAVVKAERAKGGHVIFAHAGDTLSPSLMSSLDRGAAIMMLTNMVAPDIFVPGNHEFDFGKAVFLQRMAEAKFPLYCANLRGPDGAPLPGFKDRNIVTFDGVRIGLTGATFDGTPKSSSPEDLKFTSTIGTTREQANLLRQEGADFVVAVVHADRRQDYAIFDTRTVDLVLSGHDHDLFVNYDGRNAMVESSFDAHYVTAIDVTIDVKVQDGQRIVTWWPQFRVIDTATVTPDPEVATIVAGYERQLSKEMDAPLATTTIELDGRTPTVRTQEAPIGDMIADAMREEGRADVAMMNGGGIRGDRRFGPGSTISRRDVLEMLPFGNRLVTLQVKGIQLRRAVENGLSLAPNPAGRFPQISGMTVVADLSRSAGHRMTSINVGGAPLADQRTYRVATNDFMARGGDGYTMFKDAPRLLPEQDSPLLSNEVMDYLRQNGTVSGGLGGRLTVK